MSLASTEQPGMVSGLEEIVYEEGHEAVINVLNRSMTSMIGRHDPLLCHVLGSAVQAFADFDGDPVSAARHMAPRLSALGARHARLGRNLAELNQAFVRANAAVNRGLKFALKREAPHDTQRYIRTKIGEYILALHRHARVGWHRVHAHQQASAALNAGDPPDDSRLARPSDSMWLQAVAAVDNMPVEDGYRIVVSTSDSVSAGLFDHEQTLCAEDPTEVLVPASWTDEDIGALADGQVVASAAVAVAELTETAGLVRHGAELLHGGILSDDRVVVPCEDMLGLLVLHSSPRLSQMVMAKQLGAWDSMTIRRRVNVGELVLAWLESGQPINVVARGLNFAAQTAHSRMRTARSSLGEAMDDPRQRLELILALQTALPQWRRTLDVSK